MSGTARARMLRGILVWGVLAVFLFPIFWMLSTSLKRLPDVATVPPQLIPSDLFFGAYGAVLTDPEFTRSLLTSGIVATGTMTLGLVLAIPAAYGLARWRGRGSEWSSLGFIMAQLLPTIVVATPLFVLFTSLGLTNSYLGLVIANTTIILPFSVIILRPFFSAVPVEVEEAARIDGCGRLATLLRVSMPIARSGIVTVGALAFVLAWGDLVFGLTLVSDDSLRPVTVALTEYVTEFATFWNRLMAGATVASAPILIIFLVMQRQITGGLTDGSLQ